MAWYWWALSKLHCMKPWTSVNRGPHQVVVSFSFLVLFVCFLGSHGHGSWLLGIIDYRAMWSLSWHHTQQDLVAWGMPRHGKAPLSVLVLLFAHTPMNCVEPQLKDRSLLSLLSVVALVGSAQVWWESERWATMAWMFDNHTWTSSSMTSLGHIQTHLGQVQTHLCQVPTVSWALELSLWGNWAHSNSNKPGWVGLWALSV